MKKLLLLTVAIFFSLNFYCQDNPINVELKKSEVFSEKKESVLRTIFKDELNNLYVIRTLNNETSLMIDVFDENFKNVHSYDYELKKRHRVAGGFLNNNTLGFVEYFENKKEKKIEAFLHTSQKNSLDFSKKKIFEVTTDRYPSFFESLFSAGRVDRDFEGNMSFSKSGKYNVFNIDSSDKKNEHHSILVFDEDFNKLWEKEFELPYEDKRFKLQDIIVSDDAEVFVLGKVHPKKKEKKKKGGNYHYELFKISEDKVTSTKISVDDHFVATLELNFTPENKINCIGFYSNRNENRFKGVCSFVIKSENIQIENARFSPFTEQFLVDKYGKSKDKELRNIEFKNVSYTNEGDVIITAEEFFITTTYVYNQYGGYTKISYNFDDIIVVKLNQNGELQWARNINKAQTSGYYSNPLMSFGTAQTNNNEYLILNAHKNMGELSGGRVKFRESFLWKATKKNTNLYIVKFDKEGNFFYKSLLSNKEEVTPFNCRYVEQVSDNEVILYGQRKKKRQFLKITIN
ncbi:hypothetical protein [Tenacibaculum sp. IB213877]|uniref:hypothetical protein n=1 Tax=Tenacibaculum sp. IB213877 TaxID=3097351 RepID=UPI002A5AB0A7|nr:hypothetical protein [Tenacibaculum sp. IB213877]MDY0781322.1 hypothetical protein [Tenacibaculum sp. IB213877]